MVTTHPVRPDPANRPRPPQIEPGLAADVSQRYEPDVYALCALGDAGSIQTGAGSIRSTSCALARE
jgi:hypothetical protein